MISVARLSKSYGSVHAVRDLSFEVRSGEVLGFLGPNGAGKSTTMRILTGYLNPSSGSASVAGYDVVDEPLEARSRIGYLPEHTPVYTDMTVTEYLRFVAEARGVARRDRKRAVAAAITDCGLEAVAGRLIGHLSKGYRQRTCLAQSLVHRPPVLILDEPTSGLDPNQIVEVRRLVSELAKERAIIWSTHILSEVEALCERVLIINAGRAVALGSPDELKRAIPDARPLRVSVAGAPGEDAVVERISAVPGVRSVERLGSISDGTNDTPEYELRVASDDDVAVRDRIVESTREAGWRLRRLTAIDPTLEDVFRYQTRDTARGSADEPAVAAVGDGGTESDSGDSASREEVSP